MRGTAYRLKGPAGTKGDSIWRPCAPLHGPIPQRCVEVERCNSLLTTKVFRLISLKMLHVWYSDSLAMLRSLSSPHGLLTYPHYEANNRQTLESSMCIKDFP